MIRDGSKADLMERNAKQLKTSREAAEGRPKSKKTLRKSYKPSDNSKDAPFTGAALQALWLPSLPPPLPQPSPPQPSLKPFPLPATPQFSP